MIKLTEHQQPIFDNLWKFVQGDQDYHKALLNGPAGSGKAQPLYSKLLTPSGWITFNDVKVGDILYSINGERTAVTGVFPQGDKKIYSVTFSDGTKVDCCEDHLWSVYDVFNKRHSIKNIKNIEDDYIRIHRRKPPRKNCNEYRYRIPMNMHPIQFDIKNNHYIHPYILGVLIGDGSTTSNSISFGSEDPEIVEGVKKYLNENYHLSEYLYDDRCNQYKIVGKISQHKRNLYKLHIHNMKLNVKSAFKFIPHEYLFSTIEDRLHILRGIMDTDGTVDINTGGAFIRSTSYRLLTDMRFLVKSLGGNTTQITEIENTGYKDKNGVFIKTNVCFSIKFFFENGMIPFSMSRKIERYKKCRENYPIKIKNISYTGVFPCKCISVDHPSNLYMTDGINLTHNTTILSELTNKILEDASYINVAVVAPTQKALKVIKDKFPDNIKQRLKFATVHSLLGLRHKITNNGKEVYERDKSSPSKFALYDIIFVDESSMLADELFHEMEDQNYRGVKIIFIGDKNQINPVNHEHSIPMLEEQREKYGIKQYELTEIVRQAKGNPIIETSQQILKNEFQFNIGQKNVIDHQGVAILNKNQPEVINTLLKHYFCSTEFDNNADYCKVISWRNVVVDNFNQLIRGMKYGMNAPKIVIGEKLVVNRPIKGDSPDEILYNTNEDLEVLGLTVSQKELYGHQFHYYDAAVESEEEAHNIHILHEKSQKIYQQVLKKLADDAKNEKEAVRRGQKWGKYFGFQDNFSDVGFNYSITGHRAQGSTYTNCFVVYTDIRLNQNIDEQKRIFYTSCTRPREMLYIM